MNQVPASSDQLRQLVTALQDPACFDHPVARFETVETHISIVLLTGDYAYKFKKPVDLGFVDFTSLDRRRYYCEEEIRLNRRLAPAIYLDVVGIGSDSKAPRLHADPAIEYCVKMRQFPHTAELEQALAAGRIDQADFAGLARTVADFHERAAIADDSKPYGTAGQVRQQCLDNFTAMGDDLPNDALKEDLRELQHWTESELERTEALITDRHAGERVRECHGDMHVTNMIWLDGRIQVFDCIEFNEELRWIDVMNEIAFLLMDLDMRKRPDLAHVFLNAYLETGGDYAGLGLLQLFRVYRSLVRAKIAYLRLRQGDTNEAVRTRLEAHISLARQYIEPEQSTPLIITHGLSGSGKTTITDRLIPLTGAVRVRSDIERKRLVGMTAVESSHSGIGQGLYDPSHTERTYEHLADCARLIIKAGLPAIVDAAFLQSDQRLRFQNLAGSLGVPFRILDCRAPEAVLRQRISERSRRGGDASEADLQVLERQLSKTEDLTGQEKPFGVILDSGASPDLPKLARQLDLPAYSGAQN